MKRGKNSVSSRHCTSSTGKIAITSFCLFCYMLATKVITWAGLVKCLGPGAKFSVMTKCQNCFQKPRELAFQFTNCIPNPDLSVIKIKSLFHPHFCQPTLIHLSLKCSYFCFLAMRLKMKNQAIESDTPNYM